MPTVSAIAWAMFVPGWKNSLMTAVPWIVFDSTWCNPLT
jgi:hypothetical protein